MIFRKIPVNNFVSQLGCELKERCVYPIEYFCYYFWSASLLYCNSKSAEVEGAFKLILTHTVQGSTLYQMIVLFHYQDNQVYSKVQKNMLFSTIFAF